MFQAGFGRVCITPEVGVPLAGYAARTESSRGIHDDLFVRALVLQNDHACLICVSMDILALSAEFVKDLREAILHRLNIPSASIMIACTHTHGGPITIATCFRGPEAIDPGYMNYLLSATADCVAEAWSQRFPARLGIGTAQVRGVGGNRRDPVEGPVDREVGIIKVEDEQARLRAVCFNYSCHPTVLGPNNLLLTADFPAAAVKRVEQSIGSEGFAMFVNGAQGDVSVGMSPELTAIGAARGNRTFERADQLGALLADSISMSLPGIRTDPDPTLASCESTMDIPLRKMPPPEETSSLLSQAEKELDRLNQLSAPTGQLRQAQSNLLRASLTHYNARCVSESQSGILQTGLQAFRLMDTILVAVPGEMFVEIGLKIKKQMPYRTFIFGLANGYIGYIPTRDAYTRDGYEVFSSQCAPETEEIIIKAILALGNRLGNDGCQNSPSEPHERSGRTIGAEL